MINTSLKYLGKYDHLNEKFKIAYEFLQRKDLDQLEPQSINLREGVIANIQHYTTIDAKEAKFETHEKYFDVQYLISGEENFLVTNREILELDIPYNQDQDITFYKEPKNYSVINLTPGQLVVVSPEEGHKPRCSATNQMDVKKVVIKVPVFSS